MEEVVKKYIDEYSSYWEKLLRENPDDVSKSLRAELVRILILLNVDIPVLKEKNVRFKC